MFGIETIPERTSLSSRVVLALLIRGIFILLATPSNNLTINAWHIITVCFRCRSLTSSLVTLQTDEQSLEMVR